MLPVSGVVPSIVRTTFINGNDDDGGYNHYITMFTISFCLLAAKVQEGWQSAWPELLWPASGRVGKSRSVGGQWVPVGGQ